MCEVSSPFLSHCHWIHETRLIFGIKNSIDLLNRIGFVKGIGTMQPTGGVRMKQLAQQWALNVVKVSHQKKDTYINWVRYTVYVYIPSSTGVLKSPMMRIQSVMWISFIMLCVCVRPGSHVKVLTIRGSSFTLCWNSGGSIPLELYQTWNSGT